MVIRFESLQLNQLEWTEMNIRKLQGGREFIFN